MKIRQGFVSNSSSSSFIVTTTIENHERALKNLSPYVKKVLKEMKGDKSKAFGKELISFGYYSDAGGNGTFERIQEDIGCQEDESEDGEAFGPWEAFEAYQEEIGKDKANVLTTGADDGG